jgi:IMP dehydrogenase
MNNNEFVTFNDVLIAPRFSLVESRSQVSLRQNFPWYPNKIDVPVMSANMDTITDYSMVNALHKVGASACLHRFWTIEENIQEFKNCTHKPLVSVGVTDEEFLRFKALYYEAGARHFLIDVAHAASIKTVNFIKKISDFDMFYTVGNFANAESVDEFLKYLKNSNLLMPSAIKLGIGAGSVCETRTVTGVGVPQISAIQNIVEYFKTQNIYNIDIIADGGIKTSGDIAKSLAAGADLVMLGGMLAGTFECPGGIMDELGVKEFRGSASSRSYEKQGKISAHRTAEGASVSVKVKGPVNDVIQSISAGLKSSFSYVGAFDFNDFHRNARLIRVSNNTQKENGVHIFE